MSKVKKKYIEKIILTYLLVILLVIITEVSEDYIFKADPYIFELINDNKKDVLIYEIKKNPEVIDKTDFIGRTALHYAVDEKKYWAVETLLKYDIDINGKDRKGWTPLHYATFPWKENKKILILLLENGADPTIKNNEGNTPKDFADEELVQIIKKYKNN